MSTEHEELNQAFSLAYEELRRLAATVRQSEQAQTLSPTALVHEAWLKLADSPPVADSPLHFKRIVARAMRQVLVDAARQRLAAKRGSGQALVTFDEAFGVADAGPQDMLAIDEALDELAHISPRQAAMIEYRFFGGYDVVETARLLEISEATLLRDWRVARAWLSQKLSQRS